jgi:proteasome lid subunit RPN8/RPN11
VKILKAALEEVNTHASEGYPHEICGLLLGPPGGDRVTEARRARNTVIDRAHDRYEIDPLDQIRIQREADAVGLDVLGYYHSHPDHPARASITDAERSWAGPVYVIVSCENGKVVDGNAFLAEKDGGPMRQVPMEVVA